MILRRSCVFSYIMFLVCVLVSFQSHSAEEGFQWSTILPQRSGNLDFASYYRLAHEKYYKNFMVRGTVADSSYDTASLFIENQRTNLLRILSHAIRLRSTSTPQRMDSFEGFESIISSRMQPTTFNIFPVHEHIEHFNRGLIFDSVHQFGESSVYVNLAAAPVGATKPSFEMGVILNRRAKSGGETFIETPDGQIAECYYRPRSYEYRLIVTRYPLTSHEDVERVINSEHTTLDGDSRAPIELRFDSSRLNAAIRLQNVRVIHRGEDIEVRRQEQQEQQEPIPGPPNYSEILRSSIIRSTVTGSPGMF